MEEQLAVTMTFDGAVVVLGPVGEVLGRGHRGRRDVVCARPGNLREPAMMKR